MTTAPAPSVGWDDRTRRIVFATVAKGLSPADQAHFEQVCTSTGLDPLRKEIYAVARGGKMSIQTGIDGYLALANRTRELDGMRVLFYDEDGVESRVWLKRTPPVACLVEVFRKGCAHSFEASCRFEAYSQANSMWKTFGETMLAKCATTLALRRAFADVISGIGSADEMDQVEMAVPELLTQGTPAAQQQAPEPQQQAPRAAANPSPRAAAKAAPAPAQAAAPEPPTSSVETAATTLAAATSGEVVEVDMVAETVAPAPWYAAAPIIDAGDIPGPVGLLREVCSKAGLTTVGWRALSLQMGGAVPPDKAAAIARAMTPEKVANLNRGHDSTSCQTLVREGDELGPGDELGDW